MVHERLFCPQFLFVVALLNAAAQNGFAEPYNVEGSYRIYSVLLPK